MRFPIVYGLKPFVSRVSRLFGFDVSGDFIQHVEEIDGAFIIFRGFYIPVKFGILVWSWLTFRTHAYASIGILQIEKEERPLHREFNTGACIGTVIIM